MATYKVLQDIEAEDKLVGPLTLWQFIYALVAGLMIYLSAIALMKGVAFFLAFTVPVALFAIFLAVPWGGDQPTEVWAIAKLRFYLKPRKRIWDQTGMTELVTITAPKVEERPLTDGLNQHQVRSRLSALANTLDSRGWAVKNVNVNMNAQATPTYASSDRLVDVAAHATMEVPSVDIRAEDDILDEHSNPVAHNLGALIDDAAAKYRQALVNRMNQPASPPAAQPPASPSSNPAWFTTPPPAPTQPQPQLTNDDTPADDGIPQAAEETAEDEALLARIKAEQQRSQPTTHLKTIKTPEQLAEEAAERQRLEATAQAQETARRQAEAQLLSQKKAAIMNLARSNDFSVATIQRQADSVVQQTNEEMEIPLR